MNREDKQRVIGKVVAINSDRFTIELLSGIDNFNISGYDDIHYFAQLNSYVVLPYQNYFIVSEVSGVREKDLNVPFSNPKEQFLSKVKTGKYLEVLPIGTLKPTDSNSEQYKFEFGVSVYPALYTDVLYIKEKELDAIFNVNKQSEPVCEKKYEHTKENCDCPNKHYKTLSIGTSTIFPDYAVKIDIDKFFSGHSAILGNTGSGKSCTIASMLQSIYKYSKHSATGSTFIIFDVNGEYKQAFDKINETNTDIEVKNFSIDAEDGEEKFELPHWFLTIDEWALLLQATEKTQLPILRNALGFTQNLSKDTLNHIYACSIMYVFEHWESPVAKRQRIVALLEKAQFDPVIDFSGYDARFGNFSSSNKEQLFKDAVRDYIIENLNIDPNYENKKFTFSELGESLENALLYEEYHGNKQIRDYCSSLITRYKSIKDRIDFSFLTKVSSEITSEGFVDNLIGISKKHKNKQLIIIDLNVANDEMIEVISCVLSRLIFERLRRLKERNTFPVNLILEEAHRYISVYNKGIFGEAYRIFERIAKEGRKYGMFLIVSSQRPSELSKTVLSQCSNFIVHRIQNPEDLSHIRQITPHISETILRRMPSIPTQHALIFGHSVNLPTTFKVHEANPLPKSDNNRISENWFRPKGFKLSGRKSKNDEEE